MLQLLSTIPKQSYVFRLPSDPTLQTGVEHFSSIIQQAASDLLHLCWTEDWLTRLGASWKKAYKVVNENQVQLAVDGRMLYLSS